MKSKCLLENVKFMKKKSGSRIGRLIGQIFNVRLWFDWDRMKSYSQYIATGARGVFVPQQSTKSESFEAAKKRLNLTDEDLLIRQKGLLRVSILMVICAAFVFAYSIYHLYYYSIKGGLVSLVVMFLALTLAFRYHFWYFQIKERKLGCSINEWFKQCIMGDKR